MDAAGVAARLEALLPIGVRPRQLSVRTLLVGMLVALGDGRPAHLVRVHDALVGLDDSQRRRLGVVVDWPTGAHALTYRQTEYTYRLVTHALAKDDPDGAPSDHLSDVVDALVEASIPDEHKRTTTALAADWSDLETFSRPPAQRGGACADPEAHWGHRSGGGPGERDDMFFGYYFQAATMIGEDGGEPVPELARRIVVSSCGVDPPQALVPALARMHDSGVGLGDVVGDSGYAHRRAEHFAAPLRRLGARLVIDLHPSDRGPRGTHAGATCANGNLWCPATPRALLELSPLPRRASPEQTVAHDTKAAEAARYKLGRICANDADGYHRVACPAALGKLRCPLRPESMSAPHTRPEVLSPPEHPQVCCTQQTITVPPSVNAKTAQKHDYPGPSWRRSYARRTAAERTNATVKDPASNDVGRGWCRVMGLASITLFVACVFVVRNQRVLDAFNARRADDLQRAAQGRPPKTRRRRRKTLHDIVAHTPP